MNFCISRYKGWYFPDTPYYHQTGTLSVLLSFNCVPVLSACRALWVFGNNLWIIFVNAPLNYIKAVGMYSLKKSLRGATNEYLQLYVFFLEMLKIIYLLLQNSEIPAIIIFQGSVVEDMPFAYAKTKAQISCAVAMQLISIFIFAT